MYDEGVLIYDVQKINILDIKNNLRLTLPRHKEACAKSEFYQNFKDYDEDGKILNPTSLSVSPLNYQ